MPQPFLRKMGGQAQQKTSKRSPMFQLRKAARSPFFQPFRRKTDRQGADSRQRCMRLPAHLAAKPACVKPMHVSACTVTGGHTRVLTLTLLPHSWREIPLPMGGDLRARHPTPLRNRRVRHVPPMFHYVGRLLVTLVPKRVPRSSGTSHLHHPPPHLPPTTPPTTPTPHHSPHRTHTIPPHFLLTLSASSTVHVLDRLPLYVEHRHREV